MISEHPDDIILLDYVEGMLQGQASDSVRRHIATCRACRRTLAELSDTVSELERLPTAEIPHDALGRPGRAGALRALARFVPVVLAATALVCAILFTRSGAGRKHTATPPRTPKTHAQAVAVLPASVTAAKLVRSLRKTSGLQYVNVLPGKHPWTQGFVVIVPSYNLTVARSAVARLARYYRELASAEHQRVCSTPLQGKCMRVSILPLDPARSAGERAEQVPAAAAS